MSIKPLIEKEFPLANDIVYLNHAAVSPWPKRTAEAVKAFAEENAHFGAQNYPKWLGIEIKLRNQLKTLINAPSTNDIALLKNTSEALSVVASGISWNKGDNIVSSSEEFPSNRLPWLAQAKHGVEFKEIDLSKAETPEASLIHACDEKTRLLTISSVEYGTGKRINLEKLGAFCSENNILFCVDAIQSLGALPFDVQKINADFVMADAHKWLLGPEGIALFYCKQEIRDLLELHQFGWHMVKNVGDYADKDWQIADSAQRFECGSPNMLGIHALSASLSLIEEVGIDVISNNIINNSSYIIDNINNIDGLSFVSPAEKPQYAGIVTFDIKGKDMADIYANLMKNKVICANRAGGIRFSPHFYTSKEKIDKGLEIFLSII
jgi:cysteine desulfurase/selenocysteine lyase